jgi:acetyltransferase-like isoleucine patch superfamily enzyme
MGSELFGGFKIGKNSQIDFTDVPKELLKRIHISIGDNCHINFGSIKSINSTVGISMREDSVIEFGSNQSFVGTCLFSMIESSRISVGSDCLWADGFVTTSDFHSIIDVQSGLRVNHAKDVTIGNRVWLCKDYLILKGCQIGDDSVVGAHAVVVGGTYENNVVLAGNPARVVKRNIRWDQSLLD